MNRVTCVQRCTLAATDDHQPSLEALVNAVIMCSDAFALPAPPSRHMHLNEGPDMP
jgi:hypothetical protein